MNVCSQGPLLVNLSTAKRQDAAEALSVATHGVGEWGFPLHLGTEKVFGLVDHDGGVMLPQLLRTKVVFGCEQSRKSGGQQVLCYTTDGVQQGVALGPLRVMAAHLNLHPLPVIDQQDNSLHSCLADFGAICPQMDVTVEILSAFFFRLLLVAPATQVHLQFVEQATRERSKVLCRDESYATVDQHLVLLVLFGPGAVETARLDESRNIHHEGVAGVTGTDVHGIQDLEQLLYIAFWNKSLHLLQPVAPPVVVDGLGGLHRKQFAQDGAAEPPRLQKNNVLHRLALHDINLWGRGKIKLLKSFWRIQRFQNQIVCYSNLPSW